MRFERTFSFLISPIFLRMLGGALVALGLFGIAKGLFGNMDEGELWWGYVGAGIVSIGFSPGIFIWASGEADMRVGGAAGSKEGPPSDSNGQEV